MKYRYIHDIIFNEKLPSRFMPPLKMLKAFFTGYFRKVGERTNENDTKMLSMCIPNREVKYIFTEKILGWFQEIIQEKAGATFL